MEHVILCFIEDDFGARNAREIGTDRICIETDYPHSDAIWPDAPERLMQAWAPTDLTDDEINQMTHENAMRFFQFDPFTIRPREKCTVGALRAEAVGHDVSIVAKGRRVEHDEPMTLAGFAPDRVSDSHVRHNRAFWDADADSYQAAHGDAPRARAARVGRVPRSRVGAAGARRRRRAATCSSSGAAPRSGRSRSPNAARDVVGLDVSRAQLAPRPPGRARRCRSCRRAASSCRSPTPRSTSCSATTAR